MLFGSNNPPKRFDGVNMAQIKMTPFKIFVIRAVMSLLAATVLSWMYFDEFSRLNTILLASLMLFVAYVFEAFRRKGKTPPAG